MEQRARVGNRVDLIAIGFGWILSTCLGAGVENPNLLTLFDWKILERDVGFIAPTCPHLDEITCSKNRTEHAHCHCDEDCFKFGDCCFDFTRELRRTNFDSHIKCSSWNGQMNLFMVHDCPSDYTDEQVVSKCQKDQNDTAFTYLMDLPVVSRDTHVAYENIFCAICHMDDANLKPYPGSISCNNRNIIEECGISIPDHILTAANYNPGQLSWTLLPGGQQDPRTNCTNGNWYTFTCFLLIDTTGLFTSGGDEPPQFRNCPHPGTIGTCDTEKALELKSLIPVDVDRFKNLCKLYTMLVVHQGRLYKNPHCAVCNGIPLNQTRCISRQDLPSLAISLDERYQRQSAQRSWFDPILSIPFNFEGLNYNDDALFGGSLNHVGPTESKCSREQDQVYDFIHERCYNIRCGFLYRNEGGECVHRNVSQPHLNRNQGGCYLKTLQEWELQGQFKILYDVNEYNIYFYGPNLAKRQYKVCYQDPPLFEYDPIQAQIFSITSWISLLALAYHISVFTCLKRLRNLPAQNLLALALALFMTQLLLAVAVDFRRSHSICMFTSTCLHFFSLVALFWMNVMSFDICRNFATDWNRSKGGFEVPDGKRTKADNKRWFKFYSIYAWGFPLGIVTCGHFMDSMDDWLRFYQPKYATHMCWINNPFGFALLFALPACSLFLENLVLFLITLILALTKKKELGGDDAKITVHPDIAVAPINVKTPDDKEPGGASKRKMGINVTGVKFRITQRIRAYESAKRKWRFLGYFVLSTVMTITWTVLFVLIYLKEEESLIYPFVIFNGLQGVVILFFFDLKPKIYFIIFEKVVGKPHPAYRQRRLNKLKLSKADLDSIGKAKGQKDQGDHQDQLSRPKTDQMGGIKDPSSPKARPLEASAVAQSLEQVSNASSASMSMRSAQKRLSLGPKADEAAHGFPADKSLNNPGRHDAKLPNKKSADALKSKSKPRPRKRSKSAPAKNKHQMLAATPSTSQDIKSEGSPLHGASKTSRTRSGRAMKKSSLERSSHKKSRADLAKYDAWQQLKIFQSSLSLPPPVRVVASNGTTTPPGAGERALCHGNDHHKSANEAVRGEAEGGKWANDEPRASTSSRRPLHRQFSFDKGSSTAISSSADEEEEDDSSLGSSSQLGAKCLDTATQTEPRRQSRWQSTVQKSLATQRHKSCSAVTAGGRPMAATCHNQSVGGRGQKALSSITPMSTASTCSSSTGALDLDREIMISTELHDGWDKWDALNWGIGSRDVLTHLPRQPPKDSSLSQPERKITELTGPTDLSVKRSCLTHFGAEIRTSVDGPKPSISYIWKSPPPPASQETVEEGPVLTTPPTTTSSGPIPLIISVSPVLTETEESSNGPSPTNLFSSEMSKTDHDEVSQWPLGPDAINHDYPSNLSPEGGFKETSDEFGDLSLPGEIPPEYQTLAPRRTRHLSFEPPPYRDPPAYQARLDDSDLAAINEMEMEQGELAPRRRRSDSKRICSPLQPEWDGLELDTRAAGHKNSGLTVTGVHLEPEEGQESVV